MFVLFYERYTIFTRSYIHEAQILKTDDIYHSIGKIICESATSIKNFHYKEIENIERTKEILIELGYEEKLENWYVID